MYLDSKPCLRGMKLLYVCIKHDASARTQKREMSEEEVRRYSYLVRRRMRQAGEPCSNRSGGRAQPVGHTHKFGQ